MKLVSILIPTYNRFKFLINTINSIKNQTYSNIEIVVVNDGSTQKEYYNYDWENNQIKIIHLKENSKKKFGYGCVGFVRNEGIKECKGEFIAFCDDDDCWVNDNKIELQLKAMKDNNCLMSSTEGLMGMGLYNINTKYRKYNSEVYLNILQRIYKNANSNYLNNGFPKIWDLKFLSIHNCIINSSVIVSKKLLEKINGFSYNQGREDWDCWLKALKHTNSVYINEPCVYYDNGHGYGSNHNKSSLCAINATCVPRPLKSWRSHLH